MIETKNEKLVAIAILVLISLIVILTMQMESLKKDKTYYKEKFLQTCEVSNSQSRAIALITKGELNTGYTEESNLIEKSEDNINWKELNCGYYILEKEK